MLLTTKKKRQRSRSFEANHQNRRMRNHHGHHVGNQGPGEELLRLRLLRESLVLTGSNGPPFRTPGPPSTHISGCNLMCPWKGSHSEHDPPHRADTSFQLSECRKSAIRSGMPFGDPVAIHLRGEAMNKLVPFKFIAKEPATMKKERLLMIHSLL